MKKDVSYHGIACTPWNIERIAGKAIDIVDAMGRPVALVFNRSDGTTVQNARLMVNAPSMIALIESALDVFRAMVSQLGPEQFPALADLTASYERALKQIREGYLPAEPTKVQFGS
jgi:hypothetical protein